MVAGWFVHASPGWAEHILIGFSGTTADIGAPSPKLTPASVRVGGCGPANQNKTAQRCSIGDSTREHIGEPLTKGRMLRRRGQNS